MTRDSSDRDDGMEESTDDQQNLSLPHGSSSYKVLGELEAHDGVGVLGHNTAGSGAAIGVRGATDSPSGYGLHTPDDAHVAGTAELGALAGGLTGGTEITDLTGDNLSVSGGSLNAGGGGASVSDDGSQVLSDPDDLNFGSNVTVSDDGDGSVTVDASGVSVWNDDDGDSLLEPDSGYEGVDVTDVSNGRVVTTAIDSAASDLRVTTGTTSTGDARNVVVGHASNLVKSSVEGATIAGGGFDDGSTVRPNEVYDSYGTIGGGAGNSTGIDNSDDDQTYATVGGGRENRARQEFSTVGGGSHNTATGLFSTIGGGGPTDTTDETTRANTSNEAGSSYTTVGGGGDNLAGDSYSTVGGGVKNVIAYQYGAYSTIGGGDRNEIYDQHGTIAGGRGNTAGTDDTSRNAAHATVAGGRGNTASSEYATVGGGSFNDATAPNSTVGGGDRNGAYATHATIGGGGSTDDSYSTGNAVHDDYGTVGGGGDNQAGSNDSTSNAVFATVGGGKSNRATDESTTVAGGEDNTASGTAATVGGGSSNAVSAARGTVGGGSENSAGFEGATVGGGQSNSAEDTNATISGGTSNTVTASRSTVGGGRENSVGNSGATIAGGDFNSVSGKHGSVGGGKSNGAGGLAATVAGGRRNDAAGFLGTIGGGDNNGVGASFGTVSGGADNAVYDQYGSVGGGEFNQAGSNDGTSNAVYATVGGGKTNDATAGWTTVGGGENNTADYDHATVGGGRDNVAGSASATVAGGKGNDATAGWTTVGGGKNNTASYGYGTVGGGRNNEASDDNATVGGGEYNKARANNATIAGGTSNAVTAADGVVGGGYANSAYGYTDTIAGGWDNRTGKSGASQTQYATIAGGRQHVAIGRYSFIGGGAPTDASSLYADGNVVFDDYGTIAGGGGNQAGEASSGTEGAIYATVPGGRQNQASGSYSFAAGRRAKAYHDGSFVWADSTDSDFSSSGTDQFLVEAHGGVGIGTDSPTTPFHVVDDTGGQNDVPGDHIGLVEDTSDTDGNSILALRTGYTGDPGLNSNFLTFFNGNDTAVGSIEGDGSGGISLDTSAADYAEYMPRRDPDEEICPADVVGVVDGGITRETADAGQALVVSDRSAVTGNSPGQDREARAEHEVCAFVGQVPVKVRGPAEEGDLIVPSGDHDGTARAIDPAEWTPGDGPLVGRAWGATHTEGVEQVTVAVGLETGEVVGPLVARQEGRIEALEAENERLGEENEQLRRENAELASRLDALEAEVASITGGDGSPAPADD